MLSKEIFSRNLRNFMNRENMTQVDLARRLDVTKAAVNYWYNGRSIPQVLVIQKMADIFSCSTDDLLKENSFIPVSGSPEERLLHIFHNVSDEGRSYILQQAYIASQMFEKKDSVLNNQEII